MKRYHCHSGASVVKTWRVFARFQLRVTGWKGTGWKGTAWKGKSRKRGPGSRSGAGHPTYYVNLIKMKYEQAGYLTSAPTTSPLDPGVLLTINNSRRERVLVVFILFVPSLYAFASYDWLTE